VNKSNTSATDDQTMQSRGLENSNNNKMRKSSDLYTQRIMAVAAERGLIDKKHYSQMTKRGPMSKLRSLLAIEGFLPPVSSSLTKMPPMEYFVCISPSLEERLLQTSLRFMERVLSLPGAFDSGGTAAQEPGRVALSDAEWDDARAKHNRLFAKNKAMGKYCDVDPQRVLDDPRVQSLISGLCFSDCEP